MKVLPQISTEPMYFTNHFTLRIACSPKVQYFTAYFKEQRCLSSLFYSIILLFYVFDFRSSNPVFFFLNFIEIQRLRKVASYFVPIPDPSPQRQDHRLFVDG